MQPQINFQRYPENNEVFKLQHGGLVSLTSIEPPVLLSGLINEALANGAAHLNQLFLLDQIKPSEYEENTSQPASSMKIQSM